VFKPWDVLRAHVPMKPGEWYTTHGHRVVWNPRQEHAAELVFKHAIVGPLDVVELRELAGFLEDLADQREGK
jgi:hypothetical protein